MEALRVSIGMEAYAQRDPLVMYKSKSTDTFRDLFASIRLGVISQMFRLQPARPEPQAVRTAAPAEPKGGRQLQAQESKNKNRQAAKKEMSQKA